MIACSSSPAIWRKQIAPQQRKYMSTHHPRRRCYPSGRRRRPYPPQAPSRAPLSADPAQSESPSGHRRPVRASTTAISTVRLIVGKIRAKPTHSQALFLGQLLRQLLLADRRRGQCRGSGLRLLVLGCVPVVLSRQPTAIPFEVDNQDNATRRDPPAHPPRLHLPISYSVRALWAGPRAPGWRCQR